MWDLGWKVYWIHMPWRIIFAVPRTTLFWTEISDITPGICWSHWLNLGGSCPDAAVITLVLLPSPSTSSQAPPSALDISRASRVPFC